MRRIDRSNASLIRQTYEAGKLHVGLEAGGAALWLGSAFDRNLLRTEVLSFQNHLVVACMPPGEQKKW
jgi:hypothetical protein